MACSVGTIFYVFKTSVLVAALLRTGDKSKPYRHFAKLSTAVYEMVFVPRRKNYNSHLSREQWDKFNLQQYLIQINAFVFKY
jgi:hypothetical protein